MDAIEYLKERTRMCDTDGCDRCSFWCDGCQVWYAESHTTEAAISMVEEWSKAHAPKTNAQKFEEVFGANPVEYENSVTPIYVCPPAKVRPDGKCEESRNCFECLKWWDEPYKEQEK